MRPSLVRPCPICGESPLMPLEPPNVSMVVRTARGEQLVGGVLLYSCARNGHLIFLRSVDIDVSQLRPIATAAGAD